jgi:hypothetical protein
VRGIRVLGARGQQGAAIPSFSQVWAKKAMAGLEDQDGYRAE